MLTDAHCHPYNLVERLSDGENQRRQLVVICAASATSLEEFEYCERLAQQAKAEAAAPLLPCFAVHPQMPAYFITQRRIEPSVRDTESHSPSADVHPSLASQHLCESHFVDILSTLETLASQGRLAAVGETGFDLFNAVYRETEKVQDELFAAHLETALRHDLPMVIHARRAMHKVFAHASALKKCRAVIFHSWPGTAGEGEALLRRGINAFFSFGTTIILNHREVMRCCAVFPAERLLTETDAPFQPPRGREYSSYADLTSILEAMASLRAEAGNDGLTAKNIESIIENNFRVAFTA